MTGVANTQHFEHLSVPTAQACQKMISSAVAHAENIGVCVDVAVVDISGTLSAYIHMPNTFLISADLAIDKAYTAASFACSTREFGAMLDGETPYVRDGLLRRARITIVPGGFPIIVRDQLIGAIGVSGGSAEQDEAIAAAGLAIFEENIS